MSHISCYQCGANLTSKDICMSCGVNIRLYKKIFIASNQYYNSALTKAKMRNLTGAVVDLKKSLAFNKENIEARNLLGLIYYELGELVLALKEWIISKNLKEKDNPADYFMDSLRSDIETLNNRIKRYNRAVNFLREDSPDLAILELKRIAMKKESPMKAKQLYALLLMKDGMYVRAEKLLTECGKIDIGDAITQNYLNLIPISKRNRSDSVKEMMKEFEEEPINGEAVIEPVHRHEYGHYFTFFRYILVGIVIGAALTAFIVLPASKKATNKKHKAEIEKLQNDSILAKSESEAKEIEIKQLMDKVDELKKELNEIDPSAVEGYYGEYIDILKAYIENDIPEVYRLYTLLDEEKDNQVYQELYAMVKDDCENNILMRSYYGGLAFLEKEDYARALSLFQLSNTLEPNNARTIYYTAFSYVGCREIAQARDIYQILVSDYAETSWAEMAGQRLAELDEVPETEAPPEAPPETPALSETPEE